MVSPDAPDNDSSSRTASRNRFIWLAVMFVYYAEWGVITRISCRIRGTRGRLSCPRLERKRTLSSLYKTGQIYEVQWQKNAAYRFLEVCDEVIPILVFLETRKGHFCAWDVLRPRQLPSHSRDTSNRHTFLGFSRYSKRVSSDQVTPLFMLAEE